MIFMHSIQGLLELAVMKGQKYGTYIKKNVNIQSEIVQIQHVFDFYKLIET